MQATTLPSISVQINQTPYQFSAGLTILDAAKKLDIFIPTLCHNKALTPFGSCWLCVVEIKNPKPRMVPACSTELLDGMIIETDSAWVHETRKMALELLLSDHFGDCVAPCQLTGCPANIDIQGFLKNEAEGQYAKGVALIQKKAPIPNILGRACPHPCETVCRRNRVDSAVSIGAQKRYLYEKELAAGGPFFPITAALTNKKVAIIGAGPGGITAAYYLRLAGHEVTLFEKNDKPGGMTRYAIPAYRLPRSIVDKEYSDIMTHLGIHFVPNTEIGKTYPLETLITNFDAIVLAAGALLSNTIGVNGENNANVISALDFLGDLSRGKKINLGKTVLIIGGGHTAMDAARSAVRLGCTTTLIYRRSANEMPARNEIHEAQEEGVTCQFLVAPIKLEETSKGITLTCQRMQLSEADATGRKKPVPIIGSEFSLTADVVISAIGQHADYSWIPATWLNNKKQLAINPTTYQSLVNPTIFAIGDFLTGPDLIVTAVAQGRKVAVSIQQFFNKEPIIGELPIYSSTCGDLAALPIEMFAQYPKSQRINAQCIALLERQKTFKDIEISITSEQMMQEALRCLRCGCVEVVDCKLREFSELYNANQQQFKGSMRTYDKDISHPLIHIETNKCINCSSCVRACEEQKELYILGYINRGFLSRIKPEFNHPLGQTSCDGCGKCVDVCPTAGITCHSTK